MFSLAPPVKVARTQRLGGATDSSTAPHPLSLVDSVIHSGGVTLAPAAFLSGVGRHMVWLVDEDLQQLRLWNTSSPSWRRTEPRIAPIPHFAAAEEGLPLFVSEMGNAEESLAVCSERGAVSSLDHSVELQLLDGDCAVSVSCFACIRRRDCGNVVLTAIGTTGGELIVDVKENGEHTSARYSRAEGASLLPLPASAAPSLRSRGDDAAKGSLQRYRATLWQAVRALLTGGGGGSSSSAAGADEEALLHNEAGPSNGHRGGTSSRYTSGYSGAGGYDVDSLAREADGGEALAFTHAVFRANYPREIIAVNAASELMVLELSGRETLTPRWMTNVQSALGRPGHVLAVAEARHKVCVAFYATPADTKALPAIVLATFSSSQGSLIHSAQVNTVAGLVRAAREAARHHVRLHIHDSFSHALLFVGPYCVRVNVQVGVRSPCLSADTSCLDGLPGPLATLLRPDGSAVTLGATGPAVTWEGLWENHPTAVLTVTNGARDATFAGANSSPLSRSSASAADAQDADAESAEQRVAELLRAVEADGGRLTLDAAVLHESEELARQRRTHGANWTRADLNAEDTNIVLHVTRDLQRRQQRHRRFMLAVLCRSVVAQRLQPDSIAQLVSTQEALLCQLALRSLQNVGMLGSSSATLTTVPRPPPLLQRSTYPVGRGGGATSSVGGTSSVMPLLQTAAQVERCQQLLRGAILSLAGRLREDMELTSSGADGVDAAVESGMVRLQNATAVELVFSHPQHAVALLREAGEAALRRIRSTAFSSEEKLATAHAVACIFVIVAQTITESRETLKEHYALSAAVRARAWTSSQDADAGVRLAFSHMCVILSDALAESVDTPALQQQQQQRAAARDEEAAEVNMSQAIASTGQPPVFIARAAGLGLQGDLLDLIAYLLLFFLGHTSPSEADCTGSSDTSGVGMTEGNASAALRRTLLRPPFTVEPFAYPFGSPQPPPHCAALGARALQVAEALAMQFDAAEVLMAFALAVPEEDPQPASYARLAAYCERNPRILGFALHALWRERREWELLSLPRLLPTHVATARARDSFLERRAPHLLWLAAPDRFDALTLESVAMPPYVAYGPTALSHRSRCLSMGKLAWVAGGAEEGARHDALSLDAALVACQRSFLSPQCDDVTLGLQDLVQRLIALDGDGAVRAWVGAATVAAMAATNLSEDLLVQVARRCRQHDGDALTRLQQESVSDLETVRMVSSTALGAVVAACARLQDQATLARVCETVLPAGEMRLMSSWLEALWSGVHQ